MMEANPDYDKESEQAQAEHDLAEKIYLKYLEDISPGDMRDCLERMMDKDLVLLNLTFAYQDKDAFVILNNFKKEMEDMMWELAEREARRVLE